MDDFVVSSSVKNSPDYSKTKPSYKWKEQKTEICRKQTDKHSEQAFDIIFFLVIIKYVYTPRYLIIRNVYY